MEKSTGKVVAISSKNKSVLLDTKNGELWFKVSDKVEPFFSKIRKGEVTYSAVGNILHFIQNTEAPKPYNKFTKKFDTSSVDLNAEMRRITDCILSADNDFRDGKIEKGEVFEHARGLYSMIEEIRGKKEPEEKIEIQKI